MEDAKVIMVSDGEKPFWQNILAAIFYTITICFIGFFLYSIFCADFNRPKEIKGSIAFLKLSIFTLLGALKFSVVTNIFFDLEKDKMKTEYRVGLFKVNRFSEIPELQYVSVFKRAEEDYLVNLWYKGNKHFEIAQFDNTTPAFEFGKMFSEKLNLDLLDATVKGDSKWIEK